MKVKSFFQSSILTLIQLGFITHIFGQTTVGTTPFSGLPGYPNYSSITTNVTKITDVDYSLPSGILHENLSLMDFHYLNPSEESETTITGLDENNIPIIFQKYNKIYSPDATLGYKISHIVTTRDAMDYYDDRNILFKHIVIPYISNVVDPNEADSLGIWASEIQMASGIRKLSDPDFDKVENMNNGTISRIAYDANDHTKVLSKSIEFRQVEINGFGRLLYKVFTMPMEIPSGLCVTLIQTERYIDHLERIEPRNSENNIIAKEYLISPNPVQNELSISFDNVNNLKINYSIIAINGEVFVNNNTVESELKIDVSKLTPGIYVIKVSSKEHEIIEKFIKL